jgi:hypothetical protein
MRERIPRLEGTRLETRGCDAPKSGARQSALHCGRRVLPGTPVEHWASRNRRGITNIEKRIEPPKNDPLSQRAASDTRRDRLIREKIIGHSTRVVRRMNGLRFAGLRGVPSARALALLHEPSREHGGGVLVEPAIQQLANLFAKIGGVSEPRQLVALQRGKRGRQEELPRRFGLMDGHKSLLKCKLSGTVTL